MRRPTRPGRPRLLLLSIVVLGLLVPWLVLGAGPASAATGPVGPTMSLDDLRVALTTAPPGGLDGYFDTVLQGTTITPVAVKIMAVADGQNPTDGSPLILFRITDPTVLSMGGLAAGMSGSPLYVGDIADPQPASDALVGAVSYGDSFTTNGLGLATPIDLMISIENNYTVAAPKATFSPAGPAVGPFAKGAGPVLPKIRAIAPAHPVKTGTGTVRRFVVARSHADARAVHPAAGTAVFAPLSAIEIGGLPRSSQAFKQLADMFAKRGVDVISVGAGPGPSTSASLTTDLVGGASVAAVIADGRFWGAWVGTVTYSHDDVVVAFGHPADWDGPTGLAMANANVYGIWSNTLEPYKLVSLGATRGLITQDRLYGIAGVTTAALPAEVTVSATAAVGAGPSVPSTTNVPQWVAQNRDWGPGIIADACYFPVWMATDSYAFPGYESTDLKVNGIDQMSAPFQVHHANVWDDDYDVGYMAGDDVYSVVYRLLSNPNGTAPATLTDVQFSATLSSTHTRMQVLDFQIPGGLKTGSNAVHVVTRAYGEIDTKTIDAILTLPRKTSRSGYVEVFGTGEYAGWGGWGYQDDTSASSVGPPPTVQDIVAGINAWPKNDQIEIDFMPSNSSPFAPNNGTVSSNTSMTNGGDWFVTGDRYKRTPAILLRVRPVVAPQTSVRLRGYLTAWDATGAVAIYRGTSRVARLVHIKRTGGLPYFTLALKHITKATVFRIVFDGSDRYIGATKRFTVRVVHRPPPTLLP
jgi:hypothetical protein